MVDTEVLSIIFLVLDAILLLYRFSHTYLNASMIVKGFNEELGKQQIEEQEYYTRPVMPAVTASTPINSKYKQKCEYSHIPMGQANMENSSYQYDYQGNGPSYHGNGTGVKPGVGSDVAEGVYVINGGRTDFCKILTDLVAKLVLSSSLSRLIIGCCVLVLVYVAMRVVCAVAEMKFILDSNVLGTYTSGMDVQINQTNWYLSDQAEYFNLVSMSIYQGQMRSELKYLQSMLQYFDLEQKRLVDNYKSEGCIITRQAAVNWTCDVNTDTPTLNIPLLPCNFIPILPNVFSALAPVELEQKLVKTLEPYIVSSRQVVIVLSYIIFIAMATMTIVHITGVVVFHFLKSSQKFTVRRVFVTSYLPHGAGVTGGNAGGCDDLPPPPTEEEESDYESDEVEGLNKGVTRGGGRWQQSGSLGKYRGLSTGSGGKERYMRTYPSPARGRPNVEQTGTLLNDFKYSETKV